MDLSERLASSCYLTSGLSREQSDKVAGLAKVESYKDLDVIIKEFDEADYFCIILEGKIQVRNQPGEIIARYETGSVVGELSLFEGGNRIANVIADGDCTIARIDADDMNGLIRSHPEIGVVVLRNLGQTLCHRLRSSNFQLEAVLHAL